jgi:hypothetical protein
MPFHGPFLAVSSTVSSRFIDSFLPFHRPFLAVSSAVCWGIQFFGRRKFSKPEI